MNRLSEESSPYLLQHALNPVHWFAWGEEALQMAVSENKPILLSIGYSACHWCHVMAHESFENEQIAAIMNKYFINIKIDREERPDLDAIYMDSLQAMGLHGGWPLNVFLMPDAKPFYGGTYFPPQNWVNLLKNIHEAFKNNNAALRDSADGFAQNLLINESDKYQLKQGEFLVNTLDKMFENLYQNFDLRAGGTNRSPKFPMPSIWKFVLKYYALTQDIRALKHLKLTLDRMALGGIYDQIGGGWARYATDAEWFCPHFEKMLYDNAQLLCIYSEMYQIEKDQLYRQRVYQTIAWLAREMLHESGAFYAAIDADSEGEEGKFYIWTKQEIETILTTDAAWFCAVYTITNKGNWEHGKNILHRTSRPNSIDLSKINACHQKLFIAREKREHPKLDDKALCSWNGLLINGLANAYRVFGENKFLDLALKNANYIFNKMTIDVQTDDGKTGRGLWHCTSPKLSSAPKIYGFLDDYAALIQGYISLYQATFDEKWLNEAKQLIDYVFANFYDEVEGFFYYTDVRSEKLIARKKELFDNVIPASNSLMAENLFWLGTIMDNTYFQTISKQMLIKMQSLVDTQPEWLSNWAALAALHAMPIVEVAIVGQYAQEVRQQLEQDFYPNRVFVGSQTTSNLSLLKHRVAINNKTTIYVCKDKTCLLPTHDVAEALEQMKSINQKAAN